MSFLVNRANLLTVLETVTPGLSPSDILEQSACFVFREGWVTTFNDEVACRMKTGLDPAFEGAVAAQPLLRVLHQLPDEEVDIQPDEGQLLIGRKRRQSGIRMEAEIVLPVDTVETPESWEDIPNPQLFAAGVRVALESCGRNKDEFLTVCVHVHPEHLEGFDRFQGTRFRNRLPISRPFLVRKEAAAPLGTLEMTRIAETESWVHFRNPSKLFYSCRRHLLDYPNLDELFSFRGEPATLSKDIDGAAKLAGIFSGEDKDNDRVEVRLQDGRMRIRGEGSQGWAAQEINIAYHGAPRTFRISPKLLSEIVAEDNSRCEIGDSKLRLEGEHWVYVTGLGKVKKEAERARKPEPAAEPEPEPDPAPKRRGKASAADVPF